MALTALVALESTRWVPWAPFFFVSAVVAIVLALIAGRASASVPPLRRADVLLSIAALVFLVAWDTGIAGLAYEQLLRALGHDDVFFSPQKAIDALLHASTTQLDISLDTAFAIFGGFVLLWAPVGEELFYRQYLFGHLSVSRGAPFAAVFSSAVFGARHGMHYLLLWPDMPWGAALHWAAATFVWGLVLAFVYKRTKRVWLCCVIHFVTNLIAFALTT